MKLAIAAALLTLFGATPASAQLGVGLQFGTYHQLDIDSLGNNFERRRFAGTADLKLLVGASAFYEVPIAEQVWVGGRAGVWHAPSFDDSIPMGVIDLDAWGRLGKPLRGWNASFIGAVGLTRVDLELAGADKLIGYGYHLLGGVLFDFDLGGLQSYVSVSYEFRGVAELENDDDGGGEGLLSSGILLGLGALL